MLVHDSGRVNAMNPGLESRVVTWKTKAGMGSQVLSDVAPAVDLCYSVVTLEVNSISLVKEQQCVCVMASHYQNQAKKSREHTNFSS